MGDISDAGSPFGSVPTVPPPASFHSQVGPVGIGVAVGLSLIVLLIIYCLLRRKSKCCKRKKPTLKDKVLKKMGLQKKKEPFSVSGILARK